MRYPWWRKREIKGRATSLESLPECLGRREKTINTQTMKKVNNPSGNREKKKDTAIMMGKDTCSENGK